MHPPTVLVSCYQMQEIERQAFQSGISAASLMQEAGLGIARAILQFHPRPGTAILYLGKGNNAGDALVAARHLAAQGWQIWLRLSAAVEEFKPLPLTHFQAGGQAFILKPRVLTNTELPPGPVILLDGLLGLGARGPMTPGLARLAAEMNTLRQSAHAQTIAMDIPSGLDGDSGLPHPDCVQADLTLTVARVKTCLLADTATRHVGRIALIPLADLDGGDGDASAELITAPLLRPWLPRRAFDTHKNQAGRIAILAGSPGFFGAAELACLGALHGGGGMVTLFVKPDAYSHLAARVAPEVMVKLVADYTQVFDHPHDALVIGPGLGRSSDPEIRRVLDLLTAPTVIDADALNALSPLPPDFSPSVPCLFTPHPGEWRRLVPDLAGSDLSRRQQVETLAHRHPGLTLLLKGARTVIAHHGQPTLFNSTGHPGMATGGMGDVLSGVLGALMAQNIPSHQAATLGAWLCGRAAERAALLQHANAVLPTDVAACLGQALQDLVENAF